MTKTQQTWAIIIVSIILIVIVVKLIFTFWQTAIVGAVAFVVGYTMGYRNKSKKVKGDN
ncbi:MAG: hypothetical protein MI810_13210 [Flavobacteriales bacterium]|jgi:1,4-dihydroxy-2-naphthoate octaprenyltransferase|nr:hypothetical protein [Flavobacteriales bacterium]